MGQYFKDTAIFTAFPCKGLMFSRFGVLFILGYFASAQKGAVLQVQGGGYYSSFVRCFKITNKTKSVVCSVCTTVIFVVIMGACTQAVDTVFLFLDSVPLRKNT